MGRKKASVKNYIWSNFSTIVSLLFNFLNKTVLIKTLGTTYVGVNGLFSNILGMLSLAELGIGVAISYNLYKPLSENDITKLQALINFYRKAYRIIAAFITIAGLSIIPFLPKIAKGTDSIKNLNLIFIIFLFNTVSSYLITYKSTIISADQKNYLTTKISTAVFVVINILQIVVLLFFKTFILYLLISSVMTLAKNVYINHYTGKLYPFLRGSNNSKLSKEDRTNLFKDVKAIIYHQVGSVIISQTDSIITSSIINVDAVGLVSNYLMIIGVIRGFIGTIFTSVQASVGNLVATTNKDYQLRFFNRFYFIAFWLGSVTSLCLLFLTEPFIKIWIGEKYIVNSYVLVLLVTNYYIFILRNPVTVINQAAGLFDKTKLSPIVESIINLVVSVVFAKKLGLVGIYIGTLCSSFVPVIWLSTAMNKYCFNISSKKYFSSYLLRFSMTVLNAAVLYLIFNAVRIENVYLLLLFRLFVCLLIPNIVIIAIFRKREEYQYFLSLAKSSALKLLKR